MNLFDKIAIDLDTLHNVVNTKRKSLREKYGRPIMVKRDMGQVNQGVANLLKDSGYKFLGPAALPKNIATSALDHVYPILYAGKNSYETVEKLKKGSDGKVKKARNLIGVNHELQEISTPRTIPGQVERYGHRSLIDVLGHENNIIATGDKYIQEGTKEIVDYRRKNEQEEMKKLLSYIDPEKAENFQFGDPNSRLNRHTLNKMRDYEKVTITKDWNKLYNFMVKRNEERKKNKLTIFTPKEKEMEEERIKHIKYVADNLDMDRFAKDKKHRYDIIKHVDKIIDNKNKNTDSHILKRRDKYLIDTHVGSYAKSNVAPPIPPRPNKALSVVKTIAQHHI